jgi:hypothetical protein
MEGGWPMGMGENKEGKRDIIHIPILSHFYHEDGCDIFF